MSTLCWFTKNSWIGIRWNVWNVFVGNICRSPQTWTKLVHAYKQINVTIKKDQFIIYIINAIILFRHSISFFSLSNIWFLVSQQTPNLVFLSLYSVFLLFFLAFSFGFIVLYLSSFVYFWIVIQSDFIYSQALDSALSIISCGPGPTT